MRNFTVYVTCGKICLKRIGHIAVESVIDGPHGSIFMQTAMAHEILKFRPMSSLRQPETGVERFQYLIGLFPIGCGVFAYLLSNQCSQFIAAIVIGRAVRNGATVIIQRIACPNAGVGIVQAVVVRVEVAFFPSKMQCQQRPHAAGILKVARPVEVPQQFVYVTEIHVIMVHLIVTARIAADISVAVLRCSPYLGRTCKRKGRILCRMRNRIGNFGHLTGSIVVEMSSCPVVPAQHIAYVCGTPAAQRHTPADSSMQPHALFPPNTVGSNSKCTAKRIEIRIGSSDSDASGQFTASLLKGKILYTAILHFLQFITGNAHIQMPVGRKAAFQCLQHCTVFCRLKTSRRVCPHISATGKLLPADGRIQHFQLAAGRQLTGKLPNGHLFRKTCQYGNFQAAIFSPCLVFQGIRTRTRIITRLTPIGFFQRCNRTVRQMQAKTDITAVVLDIRGKYRTVAGFQAPCRMSAIQSTCVAVLAVDADKLFTGRQVLQHTGSSPLMVIVGSGFYQIACFLRSFRRRSILRVRTQRDKQSKNNCKNRNTVHKVLFNSKDEGITESHSLYD